MQMESQVPSENVILCLVSESGDVSNQSKSLPQI